MKRKPDYNTQAVFLRVNSDLKNRLQEVLYKEKKTLREWFAEQAEEYIKRHGAGNPAVPLEKFLENPQYVACPTILEAEGHPWRNYSAEDLGRFQYIMATELERVKHERRKKLDTVL